MLIFLLGANAATASDLMQDRAATQRWLSQRAAASSMAPKPGLTRVVLPPVTPAESEQFIQSRVLPPNLNPRGTGTKSLVPSAPPSIAELARALRNDVDLVYEYVRNNIEYYPVWGVQKGALGTILDNQGTAFDQAALMVALLRQAGHTANFVKGRIALTGAELGAWYGVSTANACSVQQLLAAGRIPVAELFSVMGGCTAVSSLQIDHVWVKVDIGGTDFHFDPSFKPHTFKTGIDLAAASGYDATSYLNAAKVGATVTPDYIQNLHRANVRANLASYAGNLATHVRTNLPAGELADLVGGMKIAPHAGAISGKRHCRTRT
ncbi:MAG: hypothetical protein IPI73_13120 [Betaproteobacteria bacterium]|nr:hypothetical protein [Betaproteobacteria bacterium]